MQHQGAWGTTHWAGVRSHRLYLVRSWASLPETPVLEPQEEATVAPASMDPITVATQDGDLVWIGVCSQEPRRQVPP